MQEYRRTLSACQKKIDERLANDLARVIRNVWIATELAVLDDLIDRFEIPRFVRFVDMMPSMENNKIRKVVLRDAGVKPDT